MADVRPVQKNRIGKAPRFFCKGICLACVFAMLFSSCGRTAGVENTAGEAGAAETTGERLRSGISEEAAGSEAAGGGAISEKLRSGISEEAAGSETADGVSEGTADKNAADKKPPEIEGLVYQDEMSRSYATGFRVFHYQGGYTLIEAGERKYPLLPEEDAFAGTDGQWREDLIVLRRPVKGIYLAATAAMSLFAAIDALEEISFSSIRAKDWYIAEAKAAMEDGAIAYAGKYDAPDYEKLTASLCPLAIESTMILRTPQVQEKLENLGIPVFVDYSSYEGDPLGRSEWVKCYGALLGKEAEAEAFFQKQEEQVRQIEQKTMLVKETERPVVAYFFINAGGKAIVRKTGDYIPKMIEKAGGKYVFTDLMNPGSESGSVTISMEEFYRTAKDADYLVYNAVIEEPLTSVADLVTENELFADFKAVKSGQVYLADNNMYQSTDRTAEIISDLYLMMTKEAEGATYIRKLPE